MTIWQGIGLRGDDDQEDQDKWTPGHPRTWQNPIVSVQNQFSMDTGDTEKSASTGNYGNKGVLGCPPCPPEEPEKPKWKPRPGSPIRVRRSSRKASWQGIVLRGGDDQEDQDEGDTTDTTIPIVNPIFDVPEYIDNNTQNPVPSCPPVPDNAPPEPQWEAPTR